MQTPVATFAPALEARPRNRTGKSRLRMRRANAVLTSIIMGIEELVRQGAMDANVISIGGGLPAPELFPRKQMARAFLHAMHEPGCPALQYGWPEGQDDLRSWIAQRLGQRGASVEPDDVVITAGAQQGLSLATQVLLRAGRRIGVASETYPAALELFRRRGATLVTEDDAADWLYVVDGISNPHGRALLATRRAALLDSSRPIVVDEAYAELTFAGQLARPLLADAPDRVWHIGTLSKTLCPGVRIGWLIAPRPQRKSVIDLKQMSDLQTASLSQVIVERFLSWDNYEARLAKARSFYARRADALMQALRRYLPDWHFHEPAGGFSVFVQHAEPGRDEDWLRAAIAHGVCFDPGSLFRVTERPEPLAMRLCYSATKPTRLTEAVRRLASAWHDFRPSAVPVAHSFARVNSGATKPAPARLSGLFQRPLQS